MTTVFEPRFTDPKLASSIGAIANQICCALQFYQEPNDSSNQKIVLEFFPEKQERDDSLDLIDDHITITPISPPGNVQSLDEIAELATEKLKIRLSKSSAQIAAISTTITKAKIAEFTARGDIKSSHKFSPKKIRQCKISFSIRDRLEFLLEVLDNNNTTEEKILIASLPASVANIDEIGAIKWNLDQQLIIARKKSKDFWIWDAGDRGVIQFKFYRAEIGEPKGLFDLGQMHLNGLIVPKDFQAANRYFKLSATAGYKHAEKMLAKLSKQ